MLDRSRDHPTDWFVSWLILTVAFVLIAFGPNALAGHTNERSNWRAYFISVTVGGVVAALITAMGASERRRQ
jgi:purine-cytosine permease-like protein